MSKSGSDKTPNKLVRMRGDEPAENVLDVFKAQAENFSEKNIFFFAKIATDSSSFSCI
jgi:hypothetical protein